MTDDLMEAGDNNDDSVDSNVSDCEAFGVEPMRQGKRRKPDSSGESCERSTPCCEGGKSDLTDGLFVRESLSVLYGGEVAGGHVGAHVSQGIGHDQVSASRGGRDREDGGRKARAEIESGESVHRRKQAEEDTAKIVRGERSGFRDCRSRANGGSQDGLRGVLCKRHAEHGLLSIGGRRFAPDTGRKGATSGTEATYRNQQ